MRWKKRREEKPLISTVNWTYTNEKRDEKIYWNNESWGERYSRMVKYIVSMMNKNWDQWFGNLIFSMHCKAQFSTFMFQHTNDGNLNKNLKLLKNMFRENFRAYKSCKLGSNEGKGSK